MKLVPPHGPLTAPILWIGEAPGRQEVYAEKPFVGPSGRMARRTLQWAGIDDERDVRWTNAIKHNPGKFPASESGAKVLKAYADQLDAEIAAMPNLRVIVACGGPAQARLTGKIVYNEKGSWSWGIERYHSFVFRHADLPSTYRWGKQEHPQRIPEHVKIIPCLHPAGIMRSKGRDEELLLRRAVWKVKLALDNALEKCAYIINKYPSPSEMLAAFKGAELVYFDTEYAKETKQISWVGMSRDGREVWGCPWHVDYVKEINEILNDPFSIKAAHNLPADVAALEASGGRLKAGREHGIFCTLVGFHAMHPALGVGLDDAARYYISDIQQWKDMSSSDPEYNAMDVAYGWKVLEGIKEEAKSRPVDPMPEIHARMRMLAGTVGMTGHGMPVDRGVQGQLRNSTDSQARKLRYKVYLTAREMWDVRVRKAAEELAHVQQEIAVLQRPIGCEKHPTFHGLRKPASTCLTCLAYHDKAGPKRAKYAALKKSRHDLRGKVDRWSKGFSATNNYHLRWLLYSPDALKLPIQRNGGTITANRAAIDKLSTLRAVQAKGEAFKIVLDIKEAQHLHKARSTFIDVPLDSEGVAHPPYKVHGTKTGRLAGGGDKDEKSDNRYAFNALNIPREWRRMFVAPAGCVLVAADWRNVEGRLTAHFSRDPAYTEVLRRELDGGPKVHSVNASIIYGCDPTDAKSHKIMLGGQERDAYDGGKRLTHAWSYGMKPPHMARQFNIELREAVEIDNKLSAAYPRLVEWRNALIDSILGVWIPIPNTRQYQCIQEGKRFLANPFGWQLHFLGVHASQRNEVTAFLPQSTGAGMFTRCLPQLAARYHIFTGTYDSFVLSVPESEVREAGEFLIKTMEQSWPELGGKSFPAELAVGYNWGEANADNPRGLKEV